MAQPFAGNAAANFVTMPPEPNVAGAPAIA
jgi:hypothetical protein